MKRSLHIIFVPVFFTALVSGQIPLERMNRTGSDPYELGVSTSFFASKGGSAAAAEIQPPNEREKKRILSDLAEAMAIIRSNHVGGRAIDLNALTKSSIEGALQTLDPHSSYFDADEYGEFLSEEQSEYSGIGATIGGFWRGGQFDTYVTSTVAGSPAALAKLSFGDRIVKVNGESCAGRGTDDVRDAVRGAAGSILALTVERAATGRMETISIRRRIVPQPSIRDSFLLPGSIGYIAMTEGFNYTTANELDAARRQLHRQGAKGLVIDLRENPGGILEQAVRVAERFLPAGSVILTQRGRSKFDNRVWKSSNKTPETMPLVLLVNENSASASEILAGALQDHDRALIVGSRTFGKGLVQSLFDGPERTGLTLTTARYYTPSGRSIQRDYSDASLYDYYNHRIAETSLKRTEARTSANRPVFGGDGIEPDIAIASHQMNKVERNLDDAVFFFTRDLVNGRLNSKLSTGMNIVRTGFSDNADSTLNAQLVTEFERYVKSGSDTSLASVDLSTEQSFISARIDFYLTLARKGDASANRLAVSNDLPVLKALSGLPKARELALASLNTH